MPLSNSTMTKYGEIPNSAMPYLPTIEKYSKQYGVPVPIIAMTIKTESSGNPSAWNPSNMENSRGLMQISEKTALTHPAISIPLMFLDRLYEPDYNIQYGTKLLSYINDFLKPYFPKGMSEEVKWRAITSSYNQGEGYYKDALITLAEEGDEPTWDNVAYWVLNPKRRTSHPWPENVEMYSQKVVGPIDTKYLKAGISVALLAAIGAGAFLYYQTQIVKKPLGGLFA